MSAALCRPIACLQPKSHCCLFPTAADRGPLWPQGPLPTGSTNPHTANPYYITNYDTDTKMKPFSQFLLTSEKVFALIYRIQVTLPVTLFQDISL